MRRSASGSESEVSNLMIQREMCYFVICDKCDDRAQQPEIGPHANGEQLALREAENEGWLIDGDLHICPYHRSERARRA